MSGQANFHMLPYPEECEALSPRARTAFMAGLHADLAAEIAARQLARRDQRIDAFLQVSIAVLTMSAIWLLTSATEYARWGHVVGLVSQPFYLVATRRARQWGMYFVAFALCGMWLRGIVNNFPFF